MCVCDADISERVTGADCPAQHAYHTTHTTIPSLSEDSALSLPNNTHTHTHTVHTVLMEYKQSPSAGCYHAMPHVLFKSQIPAHSTTIITMYTCDVLYQTHSMITQLIAIHSHMQIIKCTMCVINKIKKFLTNCM